MSADPAQAATCAASSLAIDWTSCDQTNDYGTYVRERVTYGSPSVAGWVCRPKAAGDYPIAVINHSGFGANDAWTEPTCKAFAAHGYIAIASDYRPFPTTPVPADDVFCDGEVDDVLNMLDVIADHADADEDRVVMRGTSHGGCVTLRAYQRGVPGLVAAAAIAPPINMAGEWSYATTQLGTILNLCWLPYLPGSNCANWQSLKSGLEQVTGGTPTTAATEYAQRSASNDLPGLHNDGIPLLIANGVNDKVVPLSLACTTIGAVNALTGTPDYAAYHFTSSGTTLTGTAPAGCSGFTWNTATNPTTAGYPADHYLFAYAGYDHGHDNTTPGSLEYKIYDHVNQFLVAKT